MMKGLELAKNYYESCARPMLHEKYPEYESRIAVGLVGEGSECFGFDDALSRDLAEFMRHADCQSGPLLTFVIQSHKPPQFSHSMQYGNPG